MLLKKIISGGQTGVDQVGLEVAKQFGLETGGWIPKGFRTHAGNKPVLGELYGLKETPEKDWATRTRLNVRDSDATVWFGVESPGFKCTKKACDDFDKPFLDNFLALDLAEWLKSLKVETLNIAGNRLHKNPQASKEARKVLTECLTYMRL